MVALTSPAFLAVPQSQEPTVATACDPRLVPIKGDPLAYSTRGERCEGLYVLEVSGSADLALVAFTAGVDAAARTSEDRLQVRWGGTPDNLPLHVRAVSLRRPIYYRMDAVRRGESRQYDWPFAEVLGRLNLRHDELGILGWVEQTIGDRVSHVYVPLRLGVTSDPAPVQFVARVVPGVELSEVYVTLIALGPQGRELEYVKNDEPLNYGFYPAERAIPVKVTGLRGPGLYKLRLGARLRRGGSSTSTYVFYHAGMTS